ncbi:MAG: FHA domain-containing protein [Spirochaetales bacterium]|nr:FHA domain-containing protein [Spirochaetales bacterium]
MNEITLDIKSNLGQRLKRIRKPEKRCLLFKNNIIPAATKITIGRDKMNNIVIYDNMISRFHAVIQKINQAYFIKDLNSTNGTSVNGKMVPGGKYIRLYPNDIIQLGRTDLSFI